MNLEDLMLAGAEMADILNQDVPEGTYYLDPIARAAVAKFAWGLSDWLDEDESYPWGPAYQLRCALEAASINRPEVKHDR